MEFSLSTEVVKVAKLLDQSPALRRLAWGALVAAVLMIGVWKLDSILTAISRMHG